MSNNGRQSVANLSPVDIISQSCLKLSALRDLIRYNDKSEVDILHEQAVQDGLYFLFKDITDDLEAAAQKLGEAAS